jgi:hypothetical protein
MATSCTFKCTQVNRSGASVTDLSGTISVTDLVVVNTSPNSTGGWNTATVNGNLQQIYYVDATAAATAGVDEGWYNKIADTTFRKMTNKIV